MLKRRLFPRTRLGLFRASALIWVVALTAMTLTIPRLGRASDPGSGSMGPSSGPLTWRGTATASGATGEGDCIEGVNCDTFTLNVTGTDANWAGKYIEIRINWLLPVNDYDLYVHKNNNEGATVGSSGGGVPGTDEATAIVPIDHGPGTYTVRVVYFATVPQADQYVGTATVKTIPPSGAAIYIKGGMAFTPGRTVKCPVAEADGEPSSRCDSQGNYYISGIRGVPAGCDLWWFDLRPGSPTYDPNMRNPVYRGQPDSFTEDEAEEVGADGGGDVDLAVGFQPPAVGRPSTLAFCSLALANISTARSTDGGVTWTRNHMGNVTGGVPVDDRQWIEFWGQNKVFLLYRTFQPAVTQIQMSTDGGLTFGPARTAGLIGQVGGIDVDQRDGTVYICGTTGQVAVGVVDPNLGEPTTYTVRQVASDITGVANIFPIIKVADDGTAYLAYSNGRHIMLQHSRDRGATWSQAVRVSDGPDTRASYFPHIETGKLPGSIGITWYGTANNVNDDSSDWHVFYAQSFNATSTVPTFRQVRATDHVIHGANISTGGTLGNANRNLLDYFQMAVDPVGAAVLGYTSDHNDFDGHSFVVRQVQGPSLKDGKKLKHTQEGSQLPPPPPPPGSNDPQVTDFANDVAYGLIGVLNRPDPFDVVSIKYSVETVGLDRQLVCQMKVSEFGTIPDLTNWRMSFAANCPGTGKTGQGFSKATSDRGDQFWVRAFTRADRTSGSAWGTTTRNSDGTLTYTDLGPADSYAFSPSDKTITVKISLAKLNLRTRPGRPIVSGSVLAGLRGMTYTTGSPAAKRDIARGGTEFTVP